MMVFIPKPVPQAQEGREFRSPGDARPLTIVSTDNRFIANATRLHIEPLAAQGVSDEQRGCLPGRSLLGNKLDIDLDMRMTSAGGVSPGRFF